ncbi:MAG: glycoside hydrolase family 113 [Cyanobium sp.]
METTTSSKRFQQGIVYTSWWKGEYSSPESDQTLSGLIKPMGANWLQIIVTWYQDSFTSTSIYAKPNDSTPLDEDLMHVIQQAKSIGLDVMVKPHIDIENGEWRGNIGFANDHTAWATWFANYTAFISHYADLAQHAGADFFVVGTELKSTTHKSSEWRAVVKAVRASYFGPLTYAANHDEVDAINWWDDLDCIGVEAYYPLASNVKPSLSQLKDAWKPIVSKLESTANTWGKEIIFTEIGFQSREGASQTPWGVTSKKIDLEEQANCYQAVFDSLSGRNWWHGIFWWNWTTKLAQGGANDSGYTANRKPAEEILRSHYVQLPPVNENIQLMIFQDNFGSGWDDWSYHAKIKIIPGETAVNSPAALQVSLDGWGGLSLHHNGILTTPYYYIDFEIYAGPVALPLTASFRDAATDTDKAPGISIFQGHFVAAAEAWSWRGWQGGLGCN